MSLRTPVMARACPRPRLAAGFLTTAGQGQSSADRGRSAMLASGARASCQQIRKNCRVPFAEGADALPTKNAAHSTQARTTGRAATQWLPIYRGCLGLSFSLYFLGVCLAFYKYRHILPAIIAGRCTHSFAAKPVSAAARRRKCAAAGGMRARHASMRFHAARACASSPAMVRACATVRRRAAFSHRLSGRVPHGVRNGRAQVLPPRCCPAGQKYRTAK